MSTHRGMSRRKQAAIARILRWRRELAAQHFSAARTELDRAAVSLRAAADLEKLTEGKQP